MANRISRNPTNFNFLINPSKLKEIPRQISLYLINIPLSISKSVKCLGGHFDSQLNWTIPQQLNIKYLEQLE